MPDFPFPLPRVHCARLPAAAAINRALLAGYARTRDHPEVRRSHLVSGRYENLYVPLTLLPELGPVVEAAQTGARALLRAERLRSGFWLNAMEPGQSTSRHCHDDDDELLVAVYYVSAPAGSGDLLLEEQGVSLRLRPEAGLFVFFSPRVLHAVETNRSGELRLSVAFNFGPAA
ncbi:MAG: hypothetical protein PVG98_02400 [Chromatiales bacterium]|jgi:hypothetical protein